MEDKDFIRTEGYSLRLKPSGAKKVTEGFQKRMNKKVPSQKHSVTWNYALLLKTRELFNTFLRKGKLLISVSLNLLLIDRILRISGKRS
jgi:CRISPR-associated protein Cas1